jgi:hypothetical protein
MAIAIPEKKNDFSASVQYHNYKGNDYGDSCLSPPRPPSYLAEGADPKVLPQNILADLHGGLLHDFGLNGVLR